MLGKSIVEPSCAQTTSIGQLLLPSWVLGLRHTVRSRRGRVLLGTSECLAGRPTSGCDGQVLVVGCAGLVSRVEVGRDFCGDAGFFDDEVVDLLFDDGFDFGDDVAWGEDERCRF